MKAVAWFVSGVLLGTVVALALLTAVEFYSSIVHPVPPGFGETMEAMCQHVANYPTWVLATAVPMWAATAFASVWVAGRVGGRSAGVLIALLLFVALVFNISMLPYPIWFKGAELLTVPAAEAIGVSRSGRRRGGQIDDN